MKKNLQFIFLCEIDFYYMAPELQPGNNNDDNDKVNGSTNIDSRVLSTRVKLPESIVSLDIVLANDLFIQTQSIERAIKTLKQLIIPRKNVRFAPETLGLSSPSSSSSSSSSHKARSQRKHVQFEPYAGNARRSNRIAERRKTIAT